RRRWWCLPPVKYKGRPPCRCASTAGELTRHCKVAQPGESLPRGSSAIDHGTEPHHVPRFRSGFVRRGGLVERLINAKDAALALIVAPAGYGKSTLLSDWAEHDPRP